MIDFEKLPWAAWLEECVSELAKEDVHVMSIAAILSDDIIYTGYFNANATDKFIMAAHISADGLLDTVLNNARMIIEAAEEQEKDDVED